MKEIERINKYKKIAETKKATIERHRNMACISLSLKVQENKLSRNQKEQTQRVFVEAKWNKNEKIAYLNEHGTLKGYDNKSKTVVHKDKDGNNVIEEYSVLGSQCKQSITEDIRSNLKTLSTQKKNGRKVGRLRFVKEVNSIGFPQFGVKNSYYIDISRNRIRLQGIKGYLKVNGLDQLKKYDYYELANCKLTRKPTGLYINLTVFVPKENVKRNNKIIGIDFGIRSNISTSEGKEYNANVQEGDRLKRLQRKLSRQKKGSKRYSKTCRFIQIEYQKLSNKKNDLANKITAELLENEVVVMQDDNIASWANKYNFGKTIQHSVLGRVKENLMMHDNVIVLSKSLPTTQFCPVCGHLTKLNLNDRTYHCKNCDHEESRDIHAARNMIWFYENRIGMGRTEFKRVEIQEQISKRFNTLKNEDGSLKREAEFFEAR